MACGIAATASRLKNTVLLKKTMRANTSARVALASSDDRMDTALRHHDFLGLRHWPGNFEAVKDFVGSSTSRPVNIGGFALGSLTSPFSLHPLPSTPFLGPFPAVHSIPHPHGPCQQTDFRYRNHVNMYRPYPCRLPAIQDLLTFLRGARPCFMGHGSKLIDACCSTFSASSMCATIVSTQRIRQWM